MILYKHICIVNNFLTIIENYMESTTRNLRIYCNRLEIIHILLIKFRPSIGRKQELVQKRYRNE